jgi:cell division protein YceG involved in septum cleavage
LLAYSLWSGGFSAAAAVVCIPAIAALAALFHPASTKALFGAEEDV